MNYSYGFKVLLGTKHALKNRRKDITDWNKREGEEVRIIEFNIDSWKTNHSVIRFKQ